MENESTTRTSSHQSRDARQSAMWRSSLKVVTRAETGGRWASADVSPTSRIVGYAAVRFPGPRHGAPIPPLLGLLALLGSLAAPAAFGCNAAGEHGEPSRADESGLSISAGVIDFGRDHETVEVGILHRFSPSTGAWAWVPTSAPS